MDSNHPSHKSASGTSAHSAPGPHCYIDPADIVPVLQEQFDYLLSHNGSVCPPGCPACRRLEQIKCCLLKPFVC